MHSAIKESKLPAANQRVKLTANEAGVDVDAEFATKAGAGGVGVVVVMAVAS
jgi:hypothetical protein